MCLSSFKSRWRASKDIICTLECGKYIGYLVYLVVGTAVQGHPMSLIFGGNRKGLSLWDFLLVIISNLGLYLAPFLRYGYTYWLKIGNFPYPSVYRPRSGWPLYNFSKSFTDPESRLLRSWQRTFRDSSLRRFHTVAWCDRQMDRRRTDAFAMAKTQHLHSKLCWRPVKIEDLRRILSRVLVIVIIIILKSIYTRRLKAKSH